MTETNRAGYLLLPAFGLLAAVFVLPILWFFYKALGELPGPFSEAMLDIYYTLTSVVVIDAFYTTFWISLAVTLAVLVVSYPIAYFLTRAKGLVFSAVILCIVVPYFTSVIVRTYSWMVLLGRNGIVNQALVSIGIVDRPLELLYNKTGILIGMTYVLMPYMVLTLYAAMKGIDLRLLSAAKGMGAGNLYVFRRVYFPLSVHGVISGSLIVFILAIGYFITPALMGGPSDVMIAMLIEREVEILVNWPTAAIMSLALLAVTMVLYVVYYRVAGVQRFMGM